ncbi:MAG: DUF1800 family protein [Planctomycetes bacterium]|nr:DUF1800 family protein [Planctomycetota bacterium]
MKPMPATRLGVRAAALGLVFATGLAAQPLPNPDLELAHHVLRRITFGANAELLGRIVSPPAGTTAMQAARSYIREQLAPNPFLVPADWPYGGTAVKTLAEPGGDLGVPPLPHGTPQIEQFNFAQPLGTVLAHALDSRWQLREVMAEFWERHFNTHLVGSQGWFLQYVGGNQDKAAAHAWYFEWQANNHYREHALDTFHDLLSFTSKHVSMVVYLHLYANVQTAPNEDYARELMELYTMRPSLPGPTPVPNYDQNDVETVARILTGWTVDPTQAQYPFLFDPSTHDTAPKPPLFTVSGSPWSVPAGATGVGEGDALLLHLAGREATKDFVCRKLIDYFLADGAADIHPTLLQQMKTAWGTLGDIKSVLSALLLSSEFLGPRYRFARARLPLEMVMSGPRAFGAQPQPNPLVPGHYNPLSLANSYLSLLAMGQGLFGYPAPNGYPQASLAQLSPSIALARIAHANEALYGPALSSLNIDLAGQIVTALPATWNNPFAVSQFLLERLYGTRWTAQDQNHLLVVFANAYFARAAAIGGTPDITSFPPSADYDYIVRSAAVAAISMTQGGAR